MHPRGSKVMLLSRLWTTTEQKLLKKKMRGVVFFGVLFAFLIWLLVGGSAEGATIDVHTRAPVLDVELEKMKSFIGAEYVAYRNHNLRVLSFALYLLEKEGHKATEEEKQIIEVAQKKRGKEVKPDFSFRQFSLAFHDVGLWTDSKLSYLDPSEAVARKTAKGTKFEKHLDLIHDIIVYHHKITAFSHPNSRHAELVEAVRRFKTTDKKERADIFLSFRADLIDFSLGIVKFAVPTADVRLVQERLPNSGFHLALLALPVRIRGWNIFKGIYELLQIFYW
jgi:hypothetical protein